MKNRPECQALPKVLDISSAIVSVTPSLLEAQAILSDTTLRRSAVYQEDHTGKPYWKSEKSAVFLYVINKPTGFSKAFLTTERMLKGW